MNGAYRFESHSPTNSSTKRMGRSPPLRYTWGTRRESSSTACLPSHRSCSAVRKVLQLSCQHRKHLVGGKRGSEESRQSPRLDLTSHLVLLNVAVEVRPIQEESFPDLNMWNRPLPNQVPYGPNGAR